VGSPQGTCGADEPVTGRYIGCEGVVPVAVSGGGGGGGGRDAGGSYLVYSLTYNNLR
jgi:hypothetical protein